MDSIIYSKEKTSSGGTPSICETESVLTTSKRVGSCQRDADRDCFEPKSHRIAGSSSCAVWWVCFSADEDTLPW